jgi:hypothetical protein
MPMWRQHKKSGFPRVTEHGQKNRCNFPSVPVPEILALDFQLLTFNYRLSIVFWIAHGSGQAGRKGVVTQTCP